MSMLVFDSTYPAFSFRATSKDLSKGGLQMGCAPLLAVVGLNPGGAGGLQPPSVVWGGAYIAPLPNFRTNRRIEEREAAIESSKREDSNEILKFS